MSESDGSAVKILILGFLAFKYEPANNNFITIDRLENLWLIMLKYYGTAQKAKLVQIDRNTLNIVFYDNNLVVSGDTIAKK